MGSPMTFIILPRVSGPTGTMMGLPVSFTSCPLTRPSVESKAIVRTLFPPKCWATSRTKRCCVPCTSRAFKIGGSSPSNYTSTTAPMTWDTFPTTNCPLENIPIGRRGTLDGLNRRRRLTLCNKLRKHGCPDLFE